MKLELSIVVPTFNESGNVAPLYHEIQNSLKDSKYEIVFVDDDSQDGTVDEINSLVEQYDNVRLIRRINKRGLSSACIEGFAFSNSKYLAVIDADLQHDPVLLGTMLQKMQSEKLDLIIASRFLEGSHITGLSRTREKISAFGNFISTVVTGVKLSDPLSGYFMINKDVIHNILHKLSGKGFKILLDIFSTCRFDKIKLHYLELPTHFRERIHGKSKLDMLVVLEFVMLLLDKILGRYVPIRFVLFVVVGLSGLLLHMLTLAGMLKICHFDFTFSQFFATFLAMISNFFVNNLFTYRDRQLHGAAMLKGLVSFCITCSVGALINITIASFFFAKGMSWIVSGLSGCMLGSVWNYAITSFTTWKQND